MDYKVNTAVATEPVSLAEARLQCKIDADDTSEDSLLTIYRSGARELAEQYCGLALAPQTLEGSLDAFPEPEDDIIYLPMPPVTSVTSIKYTDTAGVEQTLSGTKYAIGAYTQTPRRVAPTYGNYWPSTQDIPDAVRIIFVTGYTTCPPAAKAAMLLMVAWMYAHRGDEMSPDDIQPPAAKSLLNTIKRWEKS